MQSMFSEEMIWGVVSGLLSGIPALAFSVVGYVLFSWSLYTLAVRRGLQKPWLAWIPVVKLWLVGSLSDQYLYVTRREIRSKRKVLPVLGILRTILRGIALVMAVKGLLHLLDIIFFSSRCNPAMLGRLLDRSAAIASGVILPAIGISIALAIIRYMAMYDLYKSMDPPNCVVYLVLSILFPITEPFFLFCNRHKDLGMPPRREPEPAPQPEQTWQPTPDRGDPWAESTDHREYL